MPTKKKLAAAAKSPKDDSYHHGDLKAALIAVAVEMLRAKSIQDLSLREVARVAGVSQAAPYRHFRDKDHLLAAISQQGFELKSQYMRQAVAEAGDDALAMFYGCGRAYLKMGLKHPQHFQLMLTSSIVPSEKFPELKAAAAGSFSVLCQAIEYGQKAGVIGGGDPYHKALNCWSVVNGFTSLYAEGRLLWLGITEENAEAALMSLLSQFLIGTARSLSESDFGFKPFTTAESQQNKAFLDALRP